MNPRLIVRLAGALSVAACTSAFPKARTSIFPNGVYRFDERVTGLITDLRGHLRIVGDSVEILDASPACLQDKLPPTAGRSQSFRCGDFRVLASRESGHWEFTYATTKTVRTESESCVAYKTTESGVKRCVQTVKERQEHSVPVGGALNLVAIDTTPPPLPGVP